MDIKLISFTLDGAAVADKIERFLKDENHQIESFAKYPNEQNNALPDDIKSFIETVFKTSDAIIFISAAGIAVRLIAKHITSKELDPAVIVIDDTARYVIPILSGHIGGANELAEKIAAALSSEVVITTATDRHNRFAVDLWAKNSHCKVVEIDKIKLISAAILKRERIGFYSDYKIVTPLPDGLTNDTTSGIGIAVTSDKTTSPFKETIHLLPRVYIIGVGCKKGSDANTFESFILSVLSESGIDIEQVRTVASIDIKSDEQAIKLFAKKYKLIFETFTADELMQLSGDFIGSEFVRSITGADNICERASVKSSCNEKLLIKKISSNGMTMAVARADFVCKF